MKTPEKTHWTRRKSEIKGYDHSIYCTDPLGDYVRVDYSLRTKTARLTVEDRSETRYYADISAGKIVSERSSAGKIDKVSLIMKKKASLYSTVIDNGVLGIIRGCYGIGKYCATGKASAGHRSNARTQTKAVLLLIGLLSLALLAALCAAFYAKP